jgi:hypothetical protein
MNDTSYHQRLRLRADAGGLQVTDAFWAPVQAEVARWLAAQAPRPVALDAGCGAGGMAQR